MNGSEKQPDAIETDGEEIIPCQVEEEKQNDNDADPNQLKAFYKNNYESKELDSIENEKGIFRNQTTESGEVSHKEKSSSTCLICTNETETHNLVHPACKPILEVLL